LSESLVAVRESSLAFHSLPFGHPPSQRSTTPRRAPSHPIFLPVSACFFFHLSGSEEKQGDTGEGTKRSAKEGGRA
jgi:hypothetical protein